MGRLRVEVLIFRNIRSFPRNALEESLKGKVKLEKDIFLLMLMFNWKLKKQSMGCNENITVKNINHIDRYISIELRYEGTSTISVSLP